MAQLWVGEITLRIFVPPLFWKTKPPYTCSFPENFRKQNHPTRFCSMIFSSTAHPMYGMDLAVKGALSSISSFKEPSGLPSPAVSVTKKYGGPFYGK